MRSRQQAEEQHSCSAQAEWRHRRVGQVCSWSADLAAAAAAAAEAVAAAVDVGQSSLARTCLMSATGVSVEGSMRFACLQSFQPCERVKARQEAAKLSVISRGSVLLDHTCHTLQLSDLPSGAQCTPQQW